MRRRWLILIVAAVAVMAAAAGCGSGSDSTTGNGVTSGSAGASESTAPSSGAGSQHKRPSPQHSSSGGGGNAGSGSDSSHPQGEAEEVTEAHEEEASSADQSIQEFGAEAEEDERNEVVDALLAFVRAMGKGDYHTVCDDLNAKVAQELANFGKMQKSREAKTCPELLEQVVPHPEAERAKHLLEGVVTKVRVKEGDAFVLLKPAGEKLSYFVLTHEGEEWKLNSIALGAPLVP